MQNNKAIKYTKKILIINLTLVFSLIIIMESISYTIHKEIIGSNECIVEVLSNENVEMNNKISFKELFDVNNTLINKICGYKIINDTVENKYGIKLNTTKLILTNEYYVNYMPLTMIKGTFINSKMMNEGNKVVVISDKTANSLFKSLDVIGSNLIISKKIYKIIGIYKEPSSILYNMVSDGKQKVFIPATSINNLFDTYVDNLILNKSLGKNDENINDINNKLSILFGNKILSYDIITNNSYSDIKQIIDFLFFLIGLIATILFLKRNMKYVKEFICILKSKMKEHYLKEVLFSNINHVIKIFLITCITVFIIIILLSLMKFSFNIPYKYIPGDNIFDFKFYIEIISNEFYSKNAAKINSFYLNNYYLCRTVTISISLLLVVLLSYIMILNKILSYLSATLKSFEIFRSLSIVIIYGSITALTLANICSLLVNIPFKHVFIYLIFAFSINLDKFEFRKNNLLT